MSEVLVSAGITIKTSGDCHSLSDIIASRTGKTINYNTLRRMYGLAAAVNPRKSTLDILSQFVGYENFLHFNAGSPRLSFTRAKELIFVEFALGNDKEAMTLLEQLPDSTSKSDIIIQLGREIFTSGDTARALSFLNMVEPFVQGLPYSEVVHIGTSIGISRRTLSSSVCGLVNHHAYQRIIHSVFVDYPHLMGYYGAEMDALRPEQAHSSEFELFTTCLSMLRDYLAGNHTEVELPSCLELSAIHPILAGRLFSCHLMTGLYNSPKDAWHHCFGEASVSEVDLEFSHELFLYASLSNDSQLVQWCLEEFPLTSQPARQFEFSVLQTVPLLVCISRIFREDIKGARIYFRKFNLRHTHFLQKDLLEICQCAVGHRLFPNERDWKARFEILKAQTGFTRFDDNFFQNAYRLKT